MHSRHFEYHQCERPLLHKVTIIYINPLGDDKIMKEIMISSNRHGDILSSGMVSLTEAIAASKTKLIASIIYRRNTDHPGWIQIITTNPANKIELREVPFSSDNGRMSSTWRGYDLGEYLREILSEYPRSEFYLIENMKDLCNLLKSRSPAIWWE